MEYDYQTLIELKRILEGKLQILEDQILGFSERGDDNYYKQLINKAIYYRDTIHRINKQLNKI
jgi:hypothetical protein